MDTFDLLAVKCNYKAPEQVRIVEHHKRVFEFAGCKKHNIMVITPFFPSPSLPFKFSLTAPPRN